MDGKQRKRAYLAAGLIVLAILLWLVSLTAIAPENPNEGIADPRQGTEMPQLYLDASRTYAKARFEFDQSCRAIPKSLAMRNPGTIMLDNRSGNSRTITVGNVSYALSAYGWRVVMASSATLPVKLTVSCDGTNVGTLQLQK